MIESFSIKDKGYHPIIIRDGWQLAQLNFTEAQQIDQITQLDVHLKTDEAFVALAGQAVLIAASIENGKPEFEVELMELNKVYNIPLGVWHNIAMEPGSEVLIAEKSNTHIADFDHFPLSKSSQEELKRRVNALWAQDNKVHKG